MSEHIYSSYRHGLNLFLERLGKDHEQYGTLLTYQQRLLENLSDVEHYGDTETYAHDRARIIASLNQLALSSVDSSFIQLCGLLDKDVISPSTQQIQQFLPFGANIQIQIDAQQFRGSYGTRPWRGKDSPKSKQGFDERGVPDWASLWGRLRAANVGFEPGNLYLEFDSDQSKMPDIFNPVAARVVFLQPFKVSDRKVMYPDLYIDIPFTDRNPSSFANQLGILIQHDERYQIVVRYWTESVDGQTKPQELVFEGDFKSFFGEVMKHWNGFGFTELVEITQDTMTRTP